MSTITVDVPPLRQRGEDVELLAGHFVAVLNERYGSYKRLSGEALEVLRGHCWPGNVRELQHVIESAVVVCDDDIIRPQHIPLPVTLSPVPEVLGSGPANGNLPTLDELERRHIRFVLQSTGGHRGNAARILGISERNLYRKLHDLSLLS
jgi:DNA-binding NtrC family response regulator